MTRTGKIARLPQEIRDRLNRRLQDGESGRQLIEWLNALPAVQAVLRRDFEGHEISDQNLSDWKAGGYRDWLVQQEALSHAAQLAANAAELTDAAPGLMSDHLATVLTARYAAELARWNGEASVELRQKLRVLRDLCHDVAELRRGDHNAAVLKMEQSMLDRDLMSPEDDFLERFLRWAEYPKVRECIYDETTTLTEQRARLREVLGMPKEPAPGPEIQGNSR